MVDSTNNTGAHNTSGNGDINNVDPQQILQIIREQHRIATEALARMEIALNLLEAQMAAQNTHNTNATAAEPTPIENYRRPQSQQNTNTGHASFAGQARHATGNSTSPHSATSGVRHAATNGSPDAPPTPTVSTSASRRAERRANTATLTGAAQTAGGEQTNNSASNGNHSTRESVMSSYYPDNGQQAQQPDHGTGSNPEADYWRNLFLQSEANNRAQQNSNTGHPHTGSANDQAYQQPHNQGGHGSIPPVASTAGAGANTTSPIVSPDLAQQTASAVTEEAPKKAGSFWHNALALSLGAGAGVGVKTGLLAATFLATNPLAQVLVVGALAGFTTSMVYNGISSLYTKSTANFTPRRVITGTVLGGVGAGLVDLATPFLSEQSSVIMDKYHATDFSGMWDKAVQAIPSFGFGSNAITNALPPVDPLAAASSAATPVDPSAVTPSVVPPIATLPVPDGGGLWNVAEAVLAQSGENMSVIEKTIQIADYNGIPQDQINLIEANTCVNVPPAGTTVNGTYNWPAIHAEVQNGLTTDPTKYFNGQACAGATTTTAGTPANTNVPASVASVAAQSPIEVAASTASSTAPVAPTTPANVVPTGNGVVTPIELYPDVILPHISIVGHDFGIPVDPQAATNAASSLADQARAAASSVTGAPVSAASLGTTVPLVPAHLPTAPLTAASPATATLTAVPQLIPVR